MAGKEWEDLTPEERQEFFDVIDLKVTPTGFTLGMSSREPKEEETDGQV